MPTFWKSPQNPRPTCLESLLGADTTACPRSRSQGRMMSSLPERRGWKGEGDAGPRRPGLGQTIPAPRSKPLGAGAGDYLTGLCARLRD